MSEIKILIADDHSILRESLKTALESGSNISVIAEARDGKEAIKKVEECNPNFVIMDINMPGVDGIQATKVIRNKFPEMKILILSMHDNKQYLLDAIEAGTNGYMLKMSSLKEVIAAVNRINENEYYFDSDLSDLMEGIERKEDESFNESNDVFSLYGITKREKEVLSLILKGKSNQEISDEVGLSFHTIVNHRRNIFSKFNVNNITELIKFAVKEKIISLN